MYRVPLQARKDVFWWQEALIEFNGKTAMWYEETEVDTLIANDACLQACAGVHQCEYYRVRFPAHITEGASIAILELWALIISIKLWGPKLRGKVVKIYCDNQAVAELIMTGRAKDLKLQQGLREVCFLAARFEIEIRAEHIAGSLNRIPDLLSRWWNGEKYRAEFRKIAPNMTRRSVRNSLFYYTHVW